MSVGAMKKGVQYLQRTRDTENKGKKRTGEIPASLGIRGQKNTAYRHHNRERMEEGQKTPKTKIS